MESQNIIPKVWLPPSNHAIKFNCDGAVLSMGTLVGVRIIARNNLGELVVVAGYKVSLRLSPLAAELFVIKLTLEVVVERRMGHVIENDCLDAVRLINSGEDFLAAEGWWWIKYRDLCSCCRFLIFCMSPKLLLGQLLRLLSL